MFYYETLLAFCIKWIWNYSNACSYRTVFQSSDNTSDLVHFYYSVLQGGHLALLTFYLSMVMLLPLPEQMLCLAKRPYCLPSFLKTTSRWSVDFFWAFCDSSIINIKQLVERKIDFFFFLNRDSLILWDTLSMYVWGFWLVLFFFFFFNPLSIL